MHTHTQALSITHTYTQALSITHIHTYIHTHTHTHTHTLDKILHKYQTGLGDRVNRQHLRTGPLVSVGNGMRDGETEVKVGLGSHARKVK